MTILEAIATILHGLTGPELFVLVTIGLALLITGIVSGVRIERARWRLRHRLLFPGDRGY